MLASGDLNPVKLIRIPTPRGWTGRRDPSGTHHLHSSPATTHSQSSFTPPVCGSGVICKCLGPYVSSTTRVVYSHTPSVVDPVSMSITLSLCTPTLPLCVSLWDFLDYTLCVSLSLSDSLFLPSLGLCLRNGPFENVVRTSSVSGRRSPAPLAWSKRNRLSGSVRGKGLTRNLGGHSLPRHRCVTRIVPGHRRTLGLCRNTPPSLNSGGHLPPPSRVPVPLSHLPPRPGASRTKISDTGQTRGVPVTPRSSPLPPRTPMGIPTTTGGRDTRSLLTRPVFLPTTQTYEGSTVRGWGGPTTTN